MHRNLSKELDDGSVRDLMEAFSISEEEARDRIAEFKKKHFADRQIIHAFLKLHNPRIPVLEQDESIRRRVLNLVREMEIEESIAVALVITGDILAEGGAKTLRKGKQVSTHSDFQEMLGVSVPIPKEVLDALGVEILSG